jgi:hypothetical protein
MMVVACDCEYMKNHRIAFFKKVNYMVMNYISILKKLSQAQKHTKEGKQTI